MNVFATIWAFVNDLFATVSGLFTTIFSLGGFQFPDWLYNAIYFLLNAVGYFFPLYMYIPIINLVLAFYFVRVVLSFAMFIKSFIPTVSG